MGLKTTNCVWGYCLLACYTCTRLHLAQRAHNPVCLWSFVHVWDRHLQSERGSMHEGSLTISSRFLQYWRKTYAFNVGIVKGQRWPIESRYITVRFKPISQALKLCISPCYLKTLKCPLQHLLTPSTLISRCGGGIRSRYLLNSFKSCTP